MYKKIIFSIILVLVLSLNIKADSTGNVYILEKQTSKNKLGEISAKDFVYEGDIDKLEFRDIVKKAQIKVVNDDITNLKILKSTNDCVTKCKSDKLRYTVVVDDKSVSVYGYRATPNRTIVEINEENIYQRVKDISLLKRKYQDRNVINRDYSSLSFETKNEIALDINKQLVIISNGIFLSLLVIIVFLLSVKAQNNLLKRTVKEVID